MPKHDLQDDWDEWSSEDYETYVGELEELVEGIDGPYEVDYEIGDFPDDDLHEVTAEEVYGVVASPALPSGFNSQMTPTWYFDDSGYYAYVLVNGDESQPQKIAQLLKAKGFVCQRLGRSYHPANNRQQYDWYIRVTDRALAKPTSREIAKAIPWPSQGVVSQEAYAKVIRQEAEHFRKELERAEQEKKNTERALSVAKSELQRKERDYGQLFAKHLALEKRTSEERAHFQEQRTDREARLLALVQEIDKYRQAVEEGADKELEGSIELEELSAAVARSQTERQVAEDLLKLTEDDLEQREKELVRITNERDIAVAELEQRRFELENLEAELRSQPRAETPATPQSSQPEDEIEQMLQVLLPNILFLKGSLSFLFREAKSPIPGLKVLHRLSTSPGSFRGERGESTKEWKEIHFSTGDSAKGRMYYAQSSDSEGFYVFLSHKDTQKRDYRYLKQVKP